MHTCYSPCTNETLILDSQFSITSLGSCSSLHSQGCFSAEQMGKRPPLDEWSKYLYPLIQNIMFGGWVSTLRVDWTLWLGWPDALVSYTHHCVRELLSSDWTLTSFRSALTGHVWSSKTLSRTLLMLTGRWHLESGNLTVQHSVRYRILTSIRSAPTGRVRSRKTLSGTLLMLTKRWHPEFGHFTVQRLVSTRQLQLIKWTDWTHPPASGHN